MAFSSQPPGKIYENNVRVIFYFHFIFIFRRDEIINLVYHKEVTVDRIGAWLRHVEAEGGGARRRRPQGGLYGRQRASQVSRTDLQPLQDENKVHDKMKSNCKCNYSLILGINITYFELGPDVGEDLVAALVVVAEGVGMRVCDGRRGGVAERHQRATRPHFDNMHCTTPHKC